MDTTTRIIKRSTVIPILQRIVTQMGATMLIEPEYGFVAHITFRNGKRCFVRDGRLAINPVPSVEIAKDKGYSAFFLRTFGFPVPEGQTFFRRNLLLYVEHQRDIYAAADYADSLGYPVIIKPNSGSKGRLVTRVNSRNDLIDAANSIFADDTVLLVQRWYPGNDYRIVVFDGTIIAAYQRIPLSVIGDGVSTLEMLLNQQQSSIKHIGRDNLLKIDDHRIQLRLTQQQLTRHSILPAGSVCQLLDNANLSTGGSAVDLTEHIHPDFQRIACEITERMCLRLCGVDIITNDLTQPADHYTVIEINAFPGLDYFSSLGPAQAARVEQLYTRILHAIETEV